MTTERTPLLEQEQEDQSIESVENAAPPKHVYKEPKNFKQQALALMLVTSIWPLAFEMIYPFINQMILEIGVVDKPEDVGFYSGLVESMFAVVQLLTIIPVSKLSDTVGRKPVMLVGCLGIGLSILLFGFSRSFLWMVLTRFIGGGLGGASAAVRVIGGEITNKDNQGSVFAGMTFMYRAGQVVGQPVAGFLSHPERHWPETFSGRFWKTYPYLLPCIVGAAYSLIIVAYAYIVVEETLKKRKKRPSTSTSSVETIVATSESDTPAKPKSTLEGYLSIMTPGVISVMFANFLMVMITEVYFSVYPIFAFMPVNLGGLGLDEAGIGIHMSVRAFFHIACIVPFPHVERRLGPLRAYQVGSFFWVIVAMGFPLLSYATRCGLEGWAWNTLFISFMLLWGFTGWCWTSLMLLTNANAPSREALSSIQGLSQFSTIVAQSFAPGFATAFFSFSAKLQHIAHGYLIWVVLGFVGLGVLLHAFTLKEPSSDWREEED